MMIITNRPNNTFTINRHNSNLHNKECYNNNAAKSYAKVLTDKGIKAWTMNNVCYWVK